MEKESANGSISERIISKIFTENRLEWNFLYAGFLLYLLSDRKQFPGVETRYLDISNNTGKAEIINILLILIISLLNPAYMECRKTFCTVYDILCR